MRARRYIADKDYHYLQKWFALRGMNAPPRANLPKRGWIVDGVACIFLMKTDCKVGCLEHFCTNKEAKESDRLAACDLLIDCAFQEAKRMGADAICGSTSIEKVIALGMRYGFQTDGKPYYFFSKKLNQEKLSEVA